MPLTELEARLRPIARERIEKHLLPCDTADRIWAGKGTGRLCALCDEPIEPTEVEYEVEHQQVSGSVATMHFHIVCQSIWQLECARREHLLKHPPQS